MWLICFKMFQMTWNHQLDYQPKHTKYCSKGKPLKITITSCFQCSFPWIFSKQDQSWWQIPCKDSRTGRWTMMNKNHSVHNYLEFSPKRKMTQVNPPIHVIPIRPNFKIPLVQPWQLRICKEGWRWRHRRDHNGSCGPYRNDWWDGHAKCWCSRGSD